MTAHALIQGTLFRAPESRVSRNGNAFTMATMRVKDGDGSQFWRVIAFSESAQSELMRLAEGDALAVQGAFKAELFERDGQARISFSLTADHILALRQPPRQRERKPTEHGSDASRNVETQSVASEPRSRVERCAGLGDPDLDDAIPF